MFHNNPSPLERLTLFEPAVRTFLRATPSPINDITSVPLLSHGQDKSHLSAAFNETELFVSRLNTLIDDLTELRRTHELRLAYLHNTLHAPLLALPPEITGDIFELVMNTIDPAAHGGIVRQALCLTHTCAYWRMIGISRRRLWSRINFKMARTPRVLEMWIDRSAQGPVDVWAFQPEHLKTLQHLQSRIRYLYLNNIEYIDGASFDHLDTLCIHGSLTGGFSSWNAPALRQLWLSVYDADLTVPDTIRSSLRTLAMHSPRWGSNYVHLLASFKHLERLYLSWCPPIQDGVLESIGDMSQAGSLVHLHMVNVPSKLARILLSKCFNLKSVLLGIINNDDLDNNASDDWVVENEIIKFLCHSLRLKSLVFSIENYWQMNWPSLLESFSDHIYEDHHLLPCLQVLHIAGSYYHPEDIKPNIRRLAQALHDRNSSTASDPPIQRTYPRLWIDNKPIWEADHEWFETMDGMVERVTYKDVPLHLWEPMV